jgi:hypothetical protein
LRAALRAHIAAVFMTGSKNRQQFEDYITRFLPKQREQLTLGLELAIYEQVSGDELPDDLDEPDSDE